MKVIESSGATREEAIQKGLKELGVEMHEVERIDVVDEGSKGFLGLGKRPVKVRLSINQAPARPQRDNRREGGQDRRPARQQQQNRPNRNDNRNDNRSDSRNENRNDNRGDSRNDGRSQESGEGRDQARRNKSKKNAGRGAPESREKGGDEGRPQGRQDRNRNRDRNRPQKGNAPQRGGDQKSKPGGYHKAVPITGKSAANVSEEATEAQRLADQFENADVDNLQDTVIEALPPDAREDDEGFEVITEEQGREAAALLNEIISRMDLSAQVSFAYDKENSARLVIESEEDGGILIGKRGVTLEALQYLINRMIPQNGANDTAERVVVDVGGYVDRRHAMLRDMAISMAKRAKESRRNVRLKPLSPQERRIIHLTLEKDPHVRTFSTGDSLFRSVVINPVGGRRNDSNRRGNAPRNRETANDMDPAQFGD